jgi:hypothetical protein
MSPIKGIQPGRVHIYFFIKELSKSLTAQGRWNVKEMPRAQDLILSQGSLQWLSRGCDSPASSSPRGKSKPRWPHINLFVPQLSKPGDPRLGDQRKLQEQVCPFLWCAVMGPAPMSPAVHPS